MATKTYSLSFDGFWREEKKASVPSHSGVYGIHTCVHNKNEGTVLIKRLVYIGEAVDMNVRLDDHEGWPSWKKYLKPDEVLCICTVDVDSANRNRVEAALIFLNQPPANTALKDKYEYDETTVNVSNHCGKIVGGTAKK